MWFGGEVENLIKEIIGDVKKFIDMSKIMNGWIGGRLWKKIMGKIDVDKG